MSPDDQEPLLTASSNTHVCTCYVVGKVCDFTPKLSMYVLVQCMCVHMEIRTVRVSLSLSGTLYNILSHVHPEVYFSIETVYICMYRKYVYCILQGRFHNFDQIPKMKRQGSFYHTVLRLKEPDLFTYISWLLRRGLALQDYVVLISCTSPVLHIRMYVATWCMRCSHARA